MLSNPSPTSFSYHPSEPSSSPQAHSSGENGGLRTTTFGSAQLCLCPRSASTWQERLPRAPTPMLILPPPSFPYPCSASHPCLDSSPKLPPSLLSLPLADLAHDHTMTAAHRRPPPPRRRTPIPTPLPALSRSAGSAALPIKAVRRHPRVSISGSREKEADFFWRTQRTLLGREVVFFLLLLFFSATAASSFSSSAGGAVGAPASSSKEPSSPSCSASCSAIFSTSGLARSTRKVLSRFAHPHACPADTEAAAVRAFPNSALLRRILDRRLVLLR